MPISIGVSFPESIVPGTPLPDIAGLAGLAEQAGLDGLWVGDRLATGELSVLDSGLSLAVARARHCHHGGAGNAGLTRLEDNGGMASDPSWALARRLYRMVFLDGFRPSSTLGYVPFVAPVVTQAAVGAGHWASGRRRRALAAWASAAGFGLVTWGLGTEAPDRTEYDNLFRELGLRAPAADGTDAPAARRRSREAWRNAALAVAWMILGVPWGLRHPRRLTALAIAMEAPNVVFYVVRAAWATQRRRPRTAAGSALAAAGSVARLRAAAAEPLR